MPLPSIIEAILFDLDGTLVYLPQMEQFFDNLLVETLQEYQIEIPEEETRLALWHSGSEFEGILREWGVSEYNSFIQTFDERDLKKRRQLVDTGMIHLFSDVTVLETLHARTRLGLVTNTPPEIAMFELAYFNLDQYFEAIVMLGTIEQHLAKPEPEGLHRCLRKLGIPEQKAVMVGDSRSDILSGQRAGVSTIYIQRPEQPTIQGLSPPPDLIIDSLQELLGLV